VERVAPTRTSVLLSGETGTGKELFARAVHEFSPRREGPFVPVNCAALPEHVMESELFGHRRGSFTGAIADRRGLFEEARGGTVFLDEVSSISPAIQVKLLRVLQDRQVKRVGANALEEIDFRLVAATNADLQQLVAEGAFRADLYYRLSVVLITIPPLRDRRTDIPLLVRHFADRCAAERKLAPPPIPESLLDSLMRRPWPGNVRELEHWVERTLVTSPDGRFESAEPGRPPSNRPVLDAAVSGEWNLEMLERRYIESMLHQCDDNRTAAARALGIDRRTLHRKLKRFRLDRPQDSGW